MSLVTIYEIEHGNMLHSDTSYEQIVNYCQDNSLDTRYINTREVSTPETDLVPRIHNLCHNDYKNYKYNLSKLNFREHLFEGIHLVKDVKMNVQGRPVEAIYTYDGVLIAKIVFYFEFDTNFFLLIRRTETLYYYYDDDTLTDGYVISDEIYNPFLSSYHMQKAQSERVQARDNIINIIKSNLQVIIFSYYIQNLGTVNIQEITDNLGLFFTKYAGDLSGWIQTGTTTILDKIQNENDALFTIFLDIPYLYSESLSNTTIKDYIVFALRSN